MNPKILIVEDDPEMAEVLQHGFEQEQLAPTIAGDGETGLRLAQQGAYQTIVLDVMLPGMDGFDVARSLRQAGNRTPILMLTARDSVADVVYGLDCGAEDYVVKPFSFLELAARVRSLIRRNQPETNLLRAGDLVLNPASRSVSRAGKAIALTRGEFQLLETLMRHAGLLCAGGS
jgi:two-component system copper resistance phosphate regulon response regulator CusR